MRPTKGRAIDQPGSSTSDPLAGVIYVPATGIMLNMTASTAPRGGEVRTVPTGSTTGSLDLRYAPRHPEISDKNTAR